MGSIFDILGPVMVGPSSSHTAGAVRIGQIARQLFGVQPQKATVYLHGSFAATGNSFEIAKEQGMDFVIENKDLKGAHPNTARIVMDAEGKKTMTIQAYSIGGGRIRVSSLDGIDVNFSGESNTLIVRNVDQPGRIEEVSAALSKENVNIATMTVFRDKRGGFAVMVVETDQVVSEEVIHTLESKEGILKVIFLKANGA